MELSMPYLPVSKRFSARQISLVMLFCTVTLLSGVSVAAMPLQTGASDVIVIRNDRGGSVRERFTEIRQIAKTGRKVEIRGQHCMSSCTMFLALARVCVDPRTVFHFHGPHRFGQSLAQEDFDAWSRVISAHYPVALKTWYMKTGRFKTQGSYRISGTEIIRLGARACL
ncbi:MAG: hypothetical protein ACJAYH_000755 [Celeribacter sp.]|jgi:hypothetical protein